MNKFWVMLVAFLCLWMQPAFAEPNFPQLTGRVVDTAEVLPPAVEEKLNQDLTVFEKKSQHQFVVVTVTSLDGLDIKDYGIQLFRTWKLGRKGVNDGILFIYYPGDGTKGSGKVRIEVGRGMEYILTDADASQIVNQVVVPILKQPLPLTETAPQAIVQGAATVMEVTAITPEQKAEMDARERDQQKRDAQIAWDNFVDAMSVIFGIILLAVLGFVGWWFATKKSREEKRARELAEAAERRRLDNERWEERQKMRREAEARLRSIPQQSDFTYVRPHTRPVPSASRPMPAPKKTASENKPMERPQTVKEVRPDFYTNRSSSSSSARKSSSDSDSGRGGGSDGGYTGNGGDAGGGGADGSF